MRKLTLLFLLLLLCMPLSAMAQSTKTISAEDVTPGKERKITEDIHFIGKLNKKKPEGIGTLIYYSDAGEPVVKLSGDFNIRSNGSINVDRAQLLMTKHNILTEGSFEIDLELPDRIIVKADNRQIFESLKLSPLFRLNKVSVVNENDYAILIKQENTTDTPVKIYFRNYETLIPDYKINSDLHAVGTSRNGFLWDVRLSTRNDELFCFNIFQKPNSLYAIGFENGAVWYKTDESNNTEIIDRFQKKSGKKELKGSFKGFVANGLNGNQNAAEFEGTLQVEDKILKEGTFMLPMPAEKDIYTFFNDVFVSANPIFSNLSSNNVKSFNIVCEEPGTILNYIPPQDIELVDSLTITGILDERDVKIIDKMKNLSYLDLSETYITYDPEHKKNIRVNQEALALIGQLLNQAIDDQYIDGQISTLSYRVNKPLTQLLAKSGSVDPKTDICFMPTVSDMPLLETVNLPKLATSIDPYAFANCVSLKNIEWPSALTFIGAGCFAYCTSLKDLVFPPTLYNISTGESNNCKAFERCDGVEIVDMSKCDDFKKDYAFKFGGLPNLKVMRFPQNMRDIGFQILGDQIIDFYVPNALDKLTINIAQPTRLKDRISKGSSPTGKGIIHFSSPTPPANGYCRADEMYVPKGSITAYYSKYGDKVKYIEEK